MRVILAWTGQEATVHGGPPRAGAVLPGWESSSGVSRDEQKQGHPVHQDEYFQIRSITASEQQRSRAQDQRSGRLISGTQSFRRRLSSQNRCSFSRAGSSQDPSAGFCSNTRKRKEDLVTCISQNTITNKHLKHKVKDPDVTEANVP